MKASFFSMPRLLTFVSLSLLCVDCSDEQEAAVRAAAEQGNLPALQQALQEGGQNRSRCCWRRRTGMRIA